MLDVNGRTYQLPKAPTVLVCVDGCEPEYIAQGVAADAMPWMARTLATGTALVADCVVPSFTNPNNLSIVTGAPPSVHGICGNYLYDTASGTEVMMNDPKWLRAPWLRAQIDALKVDGRWHAVARGVLRDELSAWLRALTAQAVASGSLAGPAHDAPR